ncbi:MAG: nucleoside deaminase [Kiritimatiellia bacterium]
MRQAQAEAAKAEAEGEVPAGCVIVVPGADGRPRVVGRSHNMTEALKDPTAHAEMLAITQATAAVGDWRLERAILYVTKEPCPMCGGAIVLARVPLVVWGVDDPKRGAHTVFKMFEHPGVNHHPEVLSGVCRDACLDQLQGFFRTRRKKPAQEDEQEGQG